MSVAELEHELEAITQSVTRVFRRHDLGPHEARMQTRHGHRYMAALEDELLNRVLEKKT